MTRRWFPLASDQDTAPDIERPEAARSLMADARADPGSVSGTPCGEPMAVE